MPRFRLRTLMIVAALVAVELTLLLSLSGPIFDVLPFGPLIGIAWAFCRWRGRRSAYLRGGAWGGGVQAIPLTLLMVGSNVYERAVGIVRVGNEWSTIAFDLWFLPLASVAAGLAVGLCAELGNLVISLIIFPWRAVAPDPVRPT